MADELKRILYAKFERDGFVHEFGVRSDVSSTYATQKRTCKDFTATTSWVALDFDSLTDADELWLVNFDATNYVRLATANDDTKIFARLKASGYPIRFTPEPGQTWYVKANSSSCKCALFAVEP
jgi:hypothetical protein